MFFHRVGGLANDIPEGEYVVTLWSLMMFYYTTLFVRSSRGAKLYICTSVVIIVLFGVLTPTS